MTVSKETKRDRIRNETIRRNMEADDGVLAMMQLKCLAHASKIDGERKMKYSQNKAGRSMTKRKAEDNRPISVIY